ncbi:unnamed protein product [Amoebophrya sp. A120]|nr:unnamed protein product [Amoebophrya sp. A120]|eukprot:GSA120T00002478001.1
MSRDGEESETKVRDKSGQPSSGGTKGSSSGTTTKGLLRLRKEVAAGGRKHPRDHRELSRRLNKDYNFSQKERAADENQWQRTVGSSDADAVYRATASDRRAFSTRSVTALAPGEREDERHKEDRLSYIQRDNFWIEKWLDSSTLGAMDALFAHAQQFLRGDQFFDEGWGDLEKVQRMMILLNFHAQRALLLRTVWAEQYACNNEVAKVELFLQTRRRLQRGSEAFLALANITGSTDASGEDERGHLQGELLMSATAGREEQPTMKMDDFCNLSDFQDEERTATQRIEESAEEITKDPLDEDEPGRVAVPEFVAKGTSSKESTATSLQLGQDLLSWRRLQDYDEASTSDSKSSTNGSYQFSPWQSCPLDAIYWAGWGCHREVPAAKRDPENKPLVYLDPEFRPPFNFDFSADWPGTWSTEDIFLLKEVRRRKSDFIEWVFPEQQKPSSPLPEAGGGDEAGATASASVNESVGGSHTKTNETSGARTGKEGTATSTPPLPHQGATSRQNSRAAAAPGGPVKSSKTVLETRYGAEFEVSEYEYTSPIAEFLPDECQRGYFLLVKWIRDIPRPPPGGSSSGTDSVNEDLLQEPLAVSPEHESEIQSETMNRRTARKWRNFAGVVDLTKTDGAGDDHSSSPEADPARSKDSVMSTLSGIAPKDRRERRSKRSSEAEKGIRIQKDDSGDGINPVVGAVQPSLLSSGSSGTTKNRTDRAGPGGAAGGSSSSAAPPREAGPVDESAAARSVAALKNLVVILPFTGEMTMNESYRLATAYKTANQDTIVMITLAPMHGIRRTPKMVRHYCRTVEHVCYLTTGLTVEAVSLTYTFLNSPMFRKFLTIDPNDYQKIIVAANAAKDKEDDDAAQQAKMKMREKNKEKQKSNTAHQSSTKFEPSSRLRGGPRNLSNVWRPSFATTAKKNSGSDEQDAPEAENIRNNGSHSEQAASNGLNEVDSLYPSFTRPPRVTFTGFSLGGGCALAAAFVLLIVDPWVEVRIGSYCGPHAPTVLVDGRIRQEINFDALLADQAKVDMSQVRAQRRNPVTPGEIRSAGDEDSSGRDDKNKAGTPAGKKADEGSSASVAATTSSSPRTGSSAPSSSTNKAKMNANTSTTSKKAKVPTYGGKPITSSAIETPMRAAAVFRRFLRHHQNIDTWIGYLHSQIDHSRLSGLVVGCKDDEFVPMESVRTLYATLKAASRKALLEWHSGGHATAVVLRCGPEMTEIIRRVLSEEFD